MTPDTRTTEQCLKAENENLKNVLKNLCIDVKYASEKHNDKLLISCKGYTDAKQVLGEA